MIELQTSVKTSKHDDTTRTRTAKPEYLKLTIVSQSRQNILNLRHYVIMLSHAFTIFIVYVVSKIVFM